jgi:hypothetical protein
MNLQRLATIETSNGKADYLFILDRLARCSYLISKTMNVNSGLLDRMPGRVSS